MSIELVLGSRQESESENGKQLGSTVMSIFKPRLGRFKGLLPFTSTEYRVITSTFSYARLLIPNAGRNAPEGLDLSHAVDAERRCSLGLARCPRNLITGSLQLVPR
jgi:hypothetical protein